MTATQRLRYNMQRQLKRMEERGYRFDASLKELLKTAKYQTLKSYQRNRYKKLYSTATAEIDGRIVTGTAKRAEERREAWEKRRRRQDRIDWGRVDYQDVTSQTVQFTQGDIVYQNITDLIDQYPTKGSEILKKALRSEINQYGYDAVVNALAEMPQDQIELAEKIAFYEDDTEKLHEAIEALFSGIKGTVLSQQELKELGNMMDETADFTEY